MSYEWIEVSVRLIGQEYRDNVEIYSQRIRYEYFQQSKPGMVAEIAAVVNDLPVPQTRMSLNPEEINAEFDKEYALHKART